MPFCGYCGFENPEGAKFCGSCGAALTKEQTDLAEETPQTSTTSSPAEEEEIQLPPPPPPLKETALSPPPVPTTLVEDAKPVPLEPETQPAPEPSSAMPMPPSDTPLPPKPQSPTPQKGKGKGCLIVGIVVGLVLLLTLGGLGWWGYSYMQENNLNWEELLSGGSITKNEKKDDPETGTDESTPSDYEEEELNSQSDSIDTPLEEGEEPKEGKDGKTKEKEEKGKSDENRLLAESGRKLAERMEFPVVAYNAEPQHDMYYRNEEGDIGVKFDLKKQRSRTSIGTMEITHWLSGDKETYTLQPCGCSLYQLVNPKKPNKKTYLFVYQGGKKLIMGDQHSKQHLTKN